MAAARHGLRYNYFGLRALANSFDTLATFDGALVLRPAFASIPILAAE